MTQWVENPQGGRDRGPRGLLRAWIEVSIRPRRFFENGIAPGDQAPGLIFAMCVTAVYLGGRLVFAPETLPSFGGSILTAAIVLGVGCVLVAPLALHLAAAIQTLALIPIADDRAGVSETVQVVGYAVAPCVFVAVPVPAIQLFAAAYGFCLLVVGLVVVHGISVPRAVLSAVVPGLFVFGLAFGGIGSLESLLGVELTTDPAGG
ncbi:MAG: YIP1 family protein [Natronomonas sp.]